MQIDFYQTDYASTTQEWLNNAIHDPVAQKNEELAQRYMAQVINHRGGCDSFWLEYISA